MILYGHAVITQDVDLLGNLLTAQHTRLEVEHLGNPCLVDVPLDVFGKLGVFEVLGIRVDGIHGRITLLVRTVLLQGIEAAGHLLGVLGDRLLEVTAGR